MSNNGKKWALGAMIAGIGGYLAGILTAPKSGKETRQDIKNETLKVRQEAEKELKKLHTELDKLISQGRVKTEEVAGSTKSIGKDLLSKAEIAKQKAKEMITSLRDGDAADGELDEAINNAKKALDNLKKHATTTKKDKK